MEQEPNPFPRMELFPRINKLVHFLFDHFQQERLGDHNRSGDPASYDNAERIQLDFEAQAYTGW